MIDFRYFKLNWLWLVAFCQVLYVWASPSISLSAPPTTSSSIQNSDRPPRVLKFAGVPINQASLIKNAFPFVFEREVTLAEVDEIVRFLMKTHDYSSIEVVERPTSGGQRELVLVASVLRRIREVHVRGSEFLTNSFVLKTLNIAKGIPFERKDLLASAEELRRIYEKNGFSNAKVEIEFNLPNDKEVDINILISEGPPVEIANVTIDTQNAKLNRKLTPMFQRLKGKTLSEEVMSDFQTEISDFFQEERFLTARLSGPSIVYNAERTKAKLNFAVENPWHFVFILDGNHYFSNHSIISQFELNKFSGSTSSPSADLAEKVRKQYQAVGFTQVEVSFKEKKTESIFEHEIRFDIKEGPRVRIRNWEVTGAISRPASYYRDYLKDAASELLTNGYYNRKAIDEGSKKLIYELQNQGYLKAKIQSLRAELDKSRGYVNIFISVDEGPLTKIQQIKLEGVHSFSQNHLIDLLKIKSGDPLRLNDIEESILALKSFYRSAGYLEMRILNENEQNRIVAYNETNTQATIDLQIFEGPQINVSTILLQGNSFTHDQVIRRELTFQPGDILTPEKLETSIYHLQRLGLFGKVDIRTLEESTNIGDRTVVVEVSERDPGLFTMGLGVNNEQNITFRGYLGVAYRNLNGTGRAVSFRIDPKYSTDPRISFIENKIAMSYLEPYIFGDRNRGRINITREQSFLASESQLRTIILEENSVGLLVERDLTRYIKLTITGYSFANRRKFDRSTLETTATQNIAKIGPLVEFDTRNDAFNPSKGIYSFVNFEYSDPRIGSSEDANQSIHFVKTNASMTVYSPLFHRSDVVWANSVRGGYLANMSDKTNSGVPSEEAFFLGGRSTIRGFDSGSDERIPSLSELGETDPTQFKVKTDSHFYLLKSELRFPIHGPFGGALFYDGGAVYITQPNVKIEDPYRDSAGIGLRIATPVGPLSFDFAWKLDKKPAESPMVFHFAIGSF